MNNSNAERNETVPAFGNSETVQVLALDGGGLKGTFSASVIQSLEFQLGHSICEHFDIITGTSTGGLIALALGLGKSGQEIQDFYVENGHRIFPSRGWRGLTHGFRWVFMSKYSNKELRNTLQSLLSDTDGEQPLLGHSQKRLVIPTFLAGESIPRLLKTPHTQRYKYDWQLPMWAAGLATSAAPTYLPSFKHDGRTYLDGGLWANNPSLVGVVEAKDLGATIDNVRVLNIGTTYSGADSNYCYPLTKALRGIRFRRAGLTTWGTQLLNTVMQANSYATANMYIHQLLGRGNYFVINKQLNEGDGELDRIDVDKFVELGQSAGESCYSKLKVLFDHKAAPYVPSREAMPNGA